MRRTIDCSRGSIWPHSGTGCSTTNKQQQKRRIYNSKNATQCSQCFIHGELTSSTYWFDQGLVQGICSFGYIYLPDLQHSSFWYILVQQDECVYRLKTKVWFKPKFPNDSNFKSCSRKRASIRSHPNSPLISNRVNVSIKGPILLKFQFSCDSLC